MTLGEYTDFGFGSFPLLELYARTTTVHVDGVTDLVLSEGFVGVFEETQRRIGIRFLCIHTQTQGMGSKTIGIRDEVYERLKARKRDDESFTDLVDRLLNESTPEWREGFGTLSKEDGDELERIVERSRSQTAAGLESRQLEAIEELGDVDEDADEAS